MVQDFEYRAGGNGYSLYVDGKPADFHIFAMILDRKPGGKPGDAVWVGIGGPDRNTARQYPSPDIAFREERELIKEAYKTEALNIKGIPADPDLVWKNYAIVSFLYPLLDNICGSLVNHCEKDVRFRIDHPTGLSQYRLPHWFKVFSGARKDGSGYSLRVEGALVGRSFRFRAEGGNFTFSAEVRGKAEDMFYLFLGMIEKYQKNMGLERPDMVRYFCAVFETGSPEITERNYAAVASGDFKETQAVLDNISGSGLSGNNPAGRFGIVICSGNGGTECLLPENVTVCKKRLDDFKRLYFLPGAMLVCVREYEEQHIYFYAREAGLFYNTEDSSRNFLKRNNIMLAGIMAVIPALFAYQLEQVRGAAVDRVTAGGFGMSN